MASYLGFDIGTSSIKAILIDGAQTLIAEASVPVSVSRPHPLWSEQAPEDWW
jgi:xylulokinase